MPPPEVVPPATSTRPSCSTAQEWRERGEFMLAAADQLPSTLKNSAELTGPLASAPPLTSSRPSGKATVQAPARAVDMLLIPVNAPVVTFGRLALRRAAQHRTAAEIQRALRMRVIF